MSRIVILSVRLPDKLMTDRTLLVAGFAHHPVIRQRELEVELLAFPHSLHATSTLVRHSAPSDEIIDPR